MCSVCMVKISYDHINKVCNLRLSCGSCPVSYWLENLNDSNNTVISTQNLCMSRCCNF